eukprot:m.58000 g.58000  ORF g.58000 m.58000 type:complete len:678 (-) comp22484_c0_seq1:71-2104(-)
MASRTVIACALAAFVSGTMALPNFVVLFVDDMGIDQIQVPASQRKYGYTGNNGTINTPNIFKLAAEGMVFQTWYSGFDVCTPSRAAMMTGRLPVRSGIGSPNSIYAPNAPGPSQGINAVFTEESVGGLPLNETTLAEAVKPHGYATLAVGKWHLGQRDMYLPSSRGFDSYLGIPYSQDIGTSFWLPQGKGAPYQALPLVLLQNLTVLEQPANLFTIAEKYANIATAFIKDQAAAGKPFMAYLPFNHIHGPNSCGARWCGQSARGPVGDATEETDWIIGQVMEAIHTAGIDDNTLVFFTSDNGSPQRPDGNLPLRGYKASIWEGGYREPGIAWWPTKIKPGTMSDALVATYDIFPTVLALAGITPPDYTIDGMDISPVLFGTSDTAHECIIFYKYLHAATVAQFDNLAAVRCGDHKVYWYIDKEGAPKGLPLGIQPADKPVIFNLVTDPGENSPLSNTDPAYATALQATTLARNAHIATMEVVPDQNARGNNPAFAICGAPNSTIEYPQYPNCTLTPENWHIPICGSSNTKWCNQTADGSCPKDCPRSGPHFRPHPVPPQPVMPTSNYLGCFMDKQDGGKCDLPYIINGNCPINKAVNHSTALGDRMTPQLCNYLCLEANPTFKYFANQDQHACFCGDTYGSQGTTPQSLCNQTCTGDRHQICGGLNRNSIWKTRPLN